MRQKAHGLGFLRDQRFLLLIILVVINVLFGLTSRNFFELSNYYNMLKQMAMIAITPRVTVTRKTSSLSSFSAKAIDGPPVLLERRLPSQQGSHPSAAGAYSR